ncbi:MAG: ABC transporter substrate-binding protein, partial [Salinicola sp.]
MNKFLKLVTATTVLGLAAGSLAVAQEGPIVIGVQAPTTGSEATYGKDMFNAISLAADEINADGGLLDGRQIELISGDTACDPQQSVNAASRLASQEVTGVVGGYCSGATQPTLKTYGDANIPFVIVAANSTQLIPANPGNAVMINSTGDDQAKTALDFFEGKGIEK